MVNKYGARGLGYAIFSMIVEKEPIVIITDDSATSEQISILLEEIRDQYELRRSPTSEFKLANFEIITREEYYKRWKELAGKRLIFINEDKYIYCPGLDLLERIIEEIILSKARDPIGRIAIRITDVLSSLEIAKDYYLQYKEGKIDAKKLYSLLEARFPKKEDAHLALEIIRSFY